MSNAIKPIDEQLLFAAVDAVILERHRQHEKRGEQRYSLEYWLAVLVEEVGEYSQAIQKRYGQGKDTDQDNALEEAIHISAVALAIIEQLIEEVEGVAEIEATEPEDIFGPGTLQEPEEDEQPEEPGQDKGAGTTKADS